MAIESCRIKKCIISKYQYKFHDLMIYNKLNVIEGKIDWSYTMTSKDG